ncbi:MAG: vanadium-dependent haloperoxidase [Pseudomonadota bacterium]
MPQNFDRRQQSLDVRESAAKLAADRVHPEHLANGDEQKYAVANYPMSFTKGLEHDEVTGLVSNKQDFEAFRQAIDNGFIEPYTTRVRVPRPEGVGRRRWEAPTAGVAFDLEGPDAQAVTMPPAPALNSDELNFEMAEVYELALLRDTPFSIFDEGGGSGQNALNRAIKRLNNLPYAMNGFQDRPRLTDESGKLTRQTVFRGSSPGVGEGPYLSQFLLIGNRDLTGSLNPEDGRIMYGAQRINQRVPEAVKGVDYMTTWADWLAVQNGFDVNASNGTSSGQEFTGKYRFIHTLRDLATYVHFDALYQAYLNACLILLSSRTPFDPAFDNLSGTDNHSVLIDAENEITSTTGGFALYGGPQIQTLVTEVATRALKAVRFQKFNNHLRLRPETLSGRIEAAKVLHEAEPTLCNAFGDMADQLAETVEAVRSANASGTALLPMAFAEGSPMHPTYGAGHASVAGACVTMLKAFFDTSAVFAKVDGVAGFYGQRQLDAAKKVEFIYYESQDNGKRLVEKEIDCPLTLEGELNKLAANISIGRNMAGVHFFSDYFDSVRLGEEISIGILEEQALGYPTDPFVLGVPTFDGDVRRIGAR